MKYSIGFIIKIWYVYEVSEVLAADPNKFNCDVLHALTDQPSINETEIENHFSQTTEKLAVIGNALDISKAILCSRNFMRINITCGENEIIYKEFTSVVQAIVERIGEIDKRFRGTVIPSGSVSDGCKIGYPNEFDYLVSLDMFEDCVSNFIPDRTGFTTLKIKEDRKNGISEFLDNFGDLDSDEVRDYFRKLAYQASFDVHKTEFTQLHCHLTVHDSYTSISGLHGLKPMFLVWRGPEYKRLNVYFDINPVIRCPKWPLAALKSTTLLPDLQTHEIYAFPKHLHIDSYITSIREGKSIMRQNWCYSFVCVENQIFQQLPENLKDVFTLCKSLRMEPILPASIYSRIFLSCGNKQDVSEYDHQTDDMNESEMGAKASNDAGSSDEEIPLASSQGTDSVEDMSEIDSDVDCDYPCTEKGHLTMKNSYNRVAQSSDDDDYREEDKEIEGESIISSYYLKQVFLYEIEKIPKEKISQENLMATVPYQVYMGMLKCYEAKKFPLFFLPKHNINDSFFDDFTFQIRICRNIITMLKRLGFGPCEA